MSQETASREVCQHCGLRIYLSHDCHSHSHWKHHGSNLRECYISFAEPIPEPIPESLIGRTGDEPHRPLVCFVCGERFPVTFNFCLKHKDEYEKLKKDETAPPPTLDKAMETWRWWSGFDALTEDQRLQVFKFMDDLQKHGEAAASPQVTPSPDNDSLAFQWLQDNRYPLAAMSQMKGFTTFYLAPILEAYWNWRKPEATSGQASQVTPSPAKTRRQYVYNWMNLPTHCKVEQLRKLGLFEEGDYDIRGDEQNLVWIKRAKAKGLAEKLLGIKSVEVTSGQAEAPEIFQSRSQEKRIRTLRGEKNSLDPRQAEAPTPAKFEKEAQRG